jgi:hypothetical protein
MAEFPLDKAARLVEIFAAGPKLTRRIRAL